MANPILEGLRTGVSLAGAVADRNRRDFQDRVASDQFRRTHSLRLDINEQNRAATARNVNLTEAKALNAQWTSHIDAVDSAGTEADKQQAIQNRDAFMGRAMQNPEFRGFLEKAAGRPVTALDTPGDKPFGRFHTTKTPSAITRPDGSVIPAGGDVTVAGDDEGNMLTQATTAGDVVPDNRGMPLGMSNTDFRAINASFNEIVGAEGTAQALGDRRTDELISQAQQTISGDVRNLNQRRLALVGRRDALPADVAPVAGGAPQALGAPAPAVIPDEVFPPTLEGADVSRNVETAARIAELEVQKVKAITVDDRNQLQSRIDTLKTETGVRQERLGEKEAKKVPGVVPHVKGSLGDKVEVGAVAPTDVNTPKKQRAAYNQALITLDKQIAAAKKADKVNFEAAKRNIAIMKKLDISLDAKQFSDMINFGDPSALARQTLLAQMGMVQSKISAKNRATVNKRQEKLFNDSLAFFSKKDTKNPNSVHNRFYQAVSESPFIDDPALRGSDLHKMFRIYDKIAPFTSRTPTLDEAYIANKFDTIGGIPADADGDEILAATATYADGVRQVQQRFPERSRFQITDMLAAKTADLIENEGQDPATAYTSALAFFNQ